MTLNLYELTDRRDGPEAVYAAHSEADAVEAFVADCGGADAAADERVTARAIPADRVLRFIHPATGNPDERTARRGAGVSGEAAPGARGTRGR
jgi:hypothetical protein